MQKSKAQKQSKSEAGKLKVELKSVDGLTPYAGNARTHSEEQVNTIAESIKQFGWTNPILLDEDGTILAGHGRMAAARALGMTKVPTITLRGMTDAQKRAYVLADNQIALNSEWDEPLLREEVQAILAEGIDKAVLGNISLAADDLPSQTWNEPTIKFNLTFDNAEQQQAWFGFVRRLQQEYPSHPTLASRLVEFCRAHTPGARS